VENVAGFLMRAAKFPPGIHIHNYVDTPDMTMNGLVRSVRSVLFSKANIGPRLPYGVGMTLGKIADVIGYISGKSLPISAIRVKKFCSETSFASAAHDLDGFRPVMGLEDAIKQTLEHEFLNPDPSAPVYYSE